MSTPPAIPPADPPRSVAVVGLGHIGVSLLLALRDRLPHVRRIGVARRAEIAERVRADGLVQEAATDATALRDADVVVLCTPVDAMTGWFEAVARDASETVVTDAGSTKAWIAERGAAILGDRFTGGHPLAGRERSGYDAGEPGLFDGATWVLTPASDAAAERIAPWAAVIEALGARVEVMDPATHDAAMALVSHLPFALSAALVRAATAHPRWEQGRWLAATGFRDMARIAGGDPAMYAAVTVTNAGPMLDVLDSVERELRSVRALLESGDATAAAEYFREARDARAEWVADRARTGRPV